MKEQYVMGGDFRITPQDYFQAKGSSTNPAFFSSGRAALFAIMEDIQQTGQQGTVLVPDYLCDSVTHTIADAGRGFRFYHVGKELLPEWETIEPFLSGALAILLISYFGIVDVQPIIEKLRVCCGSGPPAVILDCVQDFYGTKKLAGYDYVFNSYRKWFAVPDGAEAHGQTGKYENIFQNANTFAQYKFAGNVLKSFADVLDDELYLALIENGEHILDESYRCQCSAISQRLIPSLDYDDIAQKRRHNAKILHEGLMEMNIRHLYREGAVPMAIPVFLEPELRDKVRKCFFAEKIFVPVHWPRKDAKYSGENEIYRRELSLICDQRYGQEEMQRELSVLRSALRSA